MPRKKTSTPGQIIIAALEKKGWTQKDLANRSGISTVAINDYITGRRKGILGRQVLRISIPLGLDPYDLAMSFVGKEIDEEMNKMLAAVKSDEAEEQTEE